MRRPSDVPAYMYMQLGLSALALLGASFALGDPPFAPQRTTGGEGTRVDGEGTSTSLDGEGAPIEGVSILDGEGMPIGGERTSTPIEGMPIEGMPEGTPAEGRAAAGGDERPPEPHGAVSLAVGERSTSAQAAGATAAEGAEAATARQLFGRQGSFRRACPSRALALTMLGAGTLVGLNGGFAGVLPQAIGTMPGLHANPQGDQADLAMTLSNIVIGAATGPLLDRCFTTAASKARFMAAQALLMVAAYALFALEVRTPEARPRLDT